MKPLIFFSYGMTKCGSTLAFELTRTALDFCGLRQTLLTENVIKRGEKINFMDVIDADHVRTLTKEVSEIGHMIVLKTHRAPTPDVEDLLRSGRAIGHAVYRDPRDMALSMVDHGRRSRQTGKPAFATFETIDDALADIRRQVRVLQQWLSLPSIRPLYYDDIAFDAGARYRSIVEDLGIDPSQARMSLIRRALVHLKLKEPPTKGEGFDRIVRHVTRRRFTQFNRGARDRYKTEMPEGQSKRFAAEFSPLIERLILNRASIGAGCEPVLRPGEPLTA